MSKNIKALFEEIAPNSTLTITEEVVEVLENAIVQRISEAVNETEAEYNGLIDTAVQSRIKALDKEYCKKLKVVVEQAENKFKTLYKKKMKKVSESFKGRMAKLKGLYDEDISSIGSQHGKEMNMLTDHVDSLMESLDTDKYGMIAESVFEQFEELFESKNLSEVVFDTANQLSNGLISEMKNMLAIDSVLVNKKFKESLVESEQTATDYKKEYEKLLSENAQLKRATKNKEAQILLEGKISKFNKTKKKFLRTIFENVDSETILTNLDEAVKAFDTKLVRHREQLRESISESRNYSDTIDGSSDTEIRSLQEYWANEIKKGQIR